METLAESKSVVEIGSDKMSIALDHIYGEEWVNVQKLVDAYLVAVSLSGDREAGAANRARYGELLNPQRREQLLPHNLDDETLNFGYLEMEKMVSEYGDEMNDRHFCLIACIVARLAVPIGQTVWNLIDPIQASCAIFGYYNLCGFEMFKRQGLLDYETITITPEAITTEPEIIIKLTVKDENFERHMLHDFPDRSKITTLGEHRYQLTL